MKKLFKILFVIIIFVIAALILIPIIFKDKIMSLVQDEINNNLNAKVEFADFNLSLIKSFPSLNISLDDLSVVGVDNFAGDTLIAFKEFAVDVNLMSALSGSKIVVNAIDIDSPKVYARILSNGAANWDIVKETGETTEEAPTDTTETKFNLGLKKLEIKNATIFYDDQQGQILAGMKNLNYSLSGDFTQDKTTIENNLSIDAVTVMYEGIKYLNKVRFGVTADINADLKNMAFIISENLIKINALQIGANGTVKMPADDIDIDMEYFAKKAEFREVLSLVPAIFLEGFEGLKTSGNFSLKGYVKGLMSDNSIPAFSLNLKVDNARFQYPDLPKSVEDINVDIKVVNPGGKGNENDINIAKFSMKMAENPVDMKMHIKTTNNDVLIKGNINGKVDLLTVKDIMPLEDTELKGQIATNLKLDGKMSSIEKERYEEFNASGDFKMQNFYYKSADLPQGITINSQMKFSPKFLDLKSFKAKTPKSDFRLQGKITNYLGYAFKDELLKGNFDFQSDNLDVNEFMPADEVPETTEEDDTAPIEAVKIPENIDFRLQSSLKKVTYDNFDINNLVGLIIVKNSRIDLSQLRMQMLGGELNLKGSYDTKNINEPKVDFSMNIAQFDLSNVAKTVSTVKKLAPIAESCLGKFSMSFDFNTALDRFMNPVYNTFSGFGSFKSKNIKVAGSKAFKELGDKIKSDKFKDFSLRNLGFEFDVENGNVHVKPFKTKISNSKATISGSNNLDQSMKYNISLEIPRKELGKAGNEIVDNLAGKAGLTLSQSQNVNLDIVVGGTVTSPKITDFNIKTASGKTVKDEVKDRAKKRAKKEIDKKKKAVTDKANKEKAKLKEKADTLKKQAKDKAKSEANKLKEEAEKRKKELEEKAKKDAKKKLKKFF